MPEKSKSKYILIQTTILNGEIKGNFEYTFYKDNGDSYILDYRFFSKSNIYKNKS